MSSHPKMLIKTLNTQISHLLISPPSAPSCVLFRCMKKVRKTCLQQSTNALSLPLGFNCPFNGSLSRHPKATIECYRCFCMGSVDAFILHLKHNPGNVDGNFLKWRGRNNLERDLGLWCLIKVRRWRTEPKSLQLWTISRGNRASPYFTAVILRLQAARMLNSPIRSMLREKSL